MPKIHIMCILFTKSSYINEQTSIQPRHIIWGKLNKDVTYPTMSLNLVSRFKLSQVKNDTGKQVNQLF